MKKRLSLGVLFLVLAACNPTGSAPVGEGASSSSGMSSASSASAAGLLDGGWKTFESDAYGYSVELPEGFAVVVGNPEASNVQYAMPKQPQHLIVLIKDSSGSLSSYLAAQDEKAKTAYEGKSSMDVLGTSAASVDGREAVVRRESWNAAGFEAVSLYVKSDGRVYQFSIYDSTTMAVDQALLSFAERVFGGIAWK